MIVGGDETNVCRLYKERESGPPVKTWDFTTHLPFGAQPKRTSRHRARGQHRSTWSAAWPTARTGAPKPSHNTMFAATITGSGANTELAYLGSYTGLREDLIEWDNANGKPLGFAASAEAGAPARPPEGFKIEGVEFAARLEHGSLRHVPRAARAAR